MRVNVYTEELPAYGRQVEIVTAEYTNSHTGRPMTNYGLRVYLKSAPELHQPPNDDDRSAVTFWCGALENIQGLISMLKREADAFKP